MFRVSWSSSFGCRDLNLVVMDPVQGTRVPTTNVNQNCLSCVPNPFEEVVISNPVSGGTYRYNALDNAAAACACSAGMVQSRFDVYKSGVIVQSNPASSLCDLFTQSFSFTY
ncbi:MAG TPA: hypothetical protein VLJ18_08550 [Thermoanaerobaculia bacterium]|nr:hypothetical protein [Thermoanaerobaculia bacterium]